MVEPPRCSERYTDCLSIIYMYTQSETVVCKEIKKVESGNCAYAHVA